MQELKHLLDTIDESGDEQVGSPLKREREAIQAKVQAKDEYAGEELRVQEKVQRRKESWGIDVGVAP